MSLKPDSSFAIKECERLGRLRPSLRTTSACLEGVPAGPPNHDRSSSIAALSPAARSARSRTWRCGSPRVCWRPARSGPSKQGRGGRRRRRVAIRPGTSSLATAWLLLSGSSCQLPCYGRRADDCFAQEAATPPVLTSLLVLGERSSARSAVVATLGPTSTPRADFSFDHGASTTLASTRCAFVATCRCDPLAGGNLHSSSCGVWKRSAAGGPVPGIGLLPVRAGWTAHSAIEQPRCTGQAARLTRTCKPADQVGGRPWLGDDPVSQHADLLDFELDDAVGLEESAEFEPAAFALGSGDCAGADEVAGVEGFCA